MESAPHYIWSEKNSHWWEASSPTRTDHQQCHSVFLIIPHANLMLPLLCSLLSYTPSFGSHNNLGSLQMKTLSVRGQVTCTHHTASKRQSPDQNQVPWLLIHWPLSVFLSVAFLWVSCLFFLHPFTSRLLRDLPPDRLKPYDSVFLPAPIKMANSGPLPSSLGSGGGEAEGDRNSSQ